MKNSLDNVGYKQELKRELGFLAVLFYGMAMLLPIAPVPVYGAISMASNGHMALAYLVALVPMSFTALSYGQMVSKYPVAGSSYTYVSRSINESFGFVTGWILLLDYLLFPIMNYIVIATYVRALFPSIPFWVIIVAAVSVVTIVNLMGIKDLSFINTALTVFGFLVVIYFIVSALHFLGSGNGTGFSYVALYNPETFSLSTLITGASIACFSFVGFDTMTTLAEEVKNPGKTLKRATIIVCISMALLFAVTAFLAQASFPDNSKFTNIDVAFLDVAKAVGGSTLSTFITIAMIAGAIAFSLDAQAGAVRLLYGMGRDGVLPKKFFAYLHPKTKVPVFSTLLLAILCIGFSWIDLNKLFPMINFGGLVAYMMVNISVIIRYYVKDKQRGVSGFINYLLLPALGFVTCLSLWLGLSADAKTIGGFWAIAGIIYLAVLTKGFKKPAIKITMN